MIAPFRQPLLTNPRVQRVHLQRETSRARLSGLMAGVLGFVCMIPYPAINIGNQSAVQMGDIVCVLACLPLLALSWRSREFVIFPLLVIPLTIAMFRTSLAGDGDISVCVKALLATSLSLVAMVAVQLYAPAHLIEMLVGIATATVLHVAVGVWQYISFGNGEFPMAWLFINQSFLSVQDNATIIAKWTQRPFGIFPEPSAMSSSLATWVLIWFAHMFGLIRFTIQPKRWQRQLFNVAAVGGLGLIILSRSGHTMVTLAAVLIFGLVWLSRARSTPRTFYGLTAGLGVALPVVLWFAAVSMGDRLGSRAEVGNSSWSERVSSLGLGFVAFSNEGIWAILFGMGPGRSAQSLADSTNVVAVFSILLCYFFETGLLGVMAVCVVASRLARVWRSIGHDLVFAAVMFAWVIGILLTTSYTQLLPLWMALGCFSIWPQLIRAVAPDELAIEARGERAAWSSRHLNGNGHSPLRQHGRQVVTVATARRSHWSR